MSNEEARKIAEQVVEQVVNCIAEKRYEDLSEYAGFGDDCSAEVLKECVEGYLDMNDLSYIDKYGVACNFHPNWYEYKQLSIYIYNNGTGFAVDYDMTTDEELNDLTLQMEFLFHENGEVRPFILDAHVL